ncbi:MAG: RNA polymerase factor sigma-54 [Candidatus Hydrogenedentes bacterium]|nr:RNA polymerase factor sigma-54 [Candidatus Hydrogenedentota bacterium]
MIRMEPRLVQTQRQQLVLTQKMQQAIHILQLSGVELEQYVQQELESNPVLELVPKQEAPEPPAPAEPPGEREEFEATFDLDDYRDQWRRKEGTDLSRNADLAARREYYQNSITKGESLSEHLLTQLRMATGDARTIQIGECIIGDINERGYFTGDLAAIAADMQTPVEEVESVLRLVQRFDPAGVGARTVVECLLLQIEVEYPDEEELKTLVLEHIEALERRQIPRIAKAMKLSVERVEELCAMLTRLDPWPGYEYSPMPPQYVTPEVVVEKDENDEYIVYLTDDRTASLRISPDYRKLARDGEMPKETRQYVRDRVESAKWLIRNIEQRQNTILRVAKAIIDVQREFLDKGVEYIKPLTLQEIADKVGIHEATVSRTTRGKYIQTPQGLFELKYFFSPGLRRDSGEEQSSKSIMSLVRKIVDEEDKRKPLSDQKIADMLKEQGLNIARRTVTKYREAMHIPSTTMRKAY